MSRSNDKFLKSLSRGDLVLATAFHTNKIHLLRLTYNKLEEEPESKVAKEEPERARALWSGRALCTVSNRYYFTPRENAGNEEDWCRICFSKWRGQNKPSVKGWTQPITDSAAGTGWPLPFGWRELPPGAHPYDVAPDGDPSLIVDGTGKVKGERRVELRRWQRGNCVVRLVEHHEEANGRAFDIRYSDVRDELHERSDHYGSQPDCVREAWKLMAKGGRP